jgi:L-threonylcarbamoyladenylate synthase
MTPLAFATDPEIAAAIPAVEQHLAAGGLLAYPTETVYGLGSRPVEEDVAALARLKGRDAGKPFLLLVAGREMAERFGLALGTAALALTDRFWPGPLTVVLPVAEGTLPTALRGPQGGVAVRWTSHAGMARLIAAVDMPLTSTSANRPGGPTAPGAGAIADTFPGPVRRGRLLVLDGGALGTQPPSTVVDCTEAVPRLIREGAIPRAELRAAVGSLVP